MDIDELRRQNIKVLEEQFGGIGALADAMGMSYTQCLNYRNGVPDSKTGKLRGMRKETAWRFEDAGGKPRGWLDQDHGASDVPENIATFIAKVKEESAQRELPEHIQQTILTLITSSPKKSS